MSTRRIPFDQESRSPSTKVAAAGVAGAVAVILAFVLGEFGVVLPPEVVAAVTALLSFVTSYYVPERIEVPDYGDQYPDPAAIFEDE